eukprot:2196423-Rhodomonas_salina.2
MAACLCTASQLMPVRGMPGPESIQPVRRASSLERAVLYKECPAMTHASTPAICSCMACDEGQEKAFKVVILVTLGSPSWHHLIVFDSVAVCKLEDDNPGLCPGGGVCVSDNDAVRGDAARASLGCRGPCLERGLGVQAGGG